MNVNAEGKLCIFLAELEGPLLARLTFDQFNALQSAITATQGILWVVRGAYLESTAPDLNMAIGLSRAIRSETLLRFATLDLDAKSELPNTIAADIITDVFQYLFNTNSSSESDMEFAERGGKLLLPRVVDDVAMNEFVYQETKQSEPQLQAFSQQGRR
jgi:hypothetical protein